LNIWLKCGIACRLSIKVAKKLCMLFSAKCI
jgi:hypothetical protein